MRALFAAGCFWGVQKTFDQIPGVLSTTVGFCGGHTENPTYNQVCNGDTGHAEAIEIFFDPEKVSYIQLLDVLWDLYHPSLEKNGIDQQWQYRSSVFYYDDEQKNQATEAKQRHEEALGFKLATEILPAPSFYAAEDYHQKYYLTHGNESC